MEQQERHQNRPKGLLDRLAAQMGCEYLSDLHGHGTRHIVREMLLQMDDGRYDAEEWSRALTYLIQEKVEFSTVEEAKSYLRGRVIP